MSADAASSWHFIDHLGSFELADPDRASRLYFPLVNEAGLMSAITPDLNGDIKTGQNAFLTLPVSAEDLHNTRSSRNFWLHVAGHGAWSAGGNSAAQLARRFTDEDRETVRLEAGLLWHRATREDRRLGLRATITNFVPPSQDHVELMQVQMTNTGGRPLAFTPTAAIPIFGRSADNLRDHRHVTSLLHRTRCHSHGVLVQPTLSFDERGHLPNRLCYAVLGAEEDAGAPLGFTPLVEDFIGEGGTLDWPETVVRNQPPTHRAGAVVEGYESIGALRFRDRTLAPGETCRYVLLLAILPDPAKAADLLATYGSPVAFQHWLERTRLHWQAQLDTLAFQTSDPRFDGWMRWVSVQPILRRLFGNSFLPYHDYGRGGRGWRDLWQDALALLIMEPSPTPGTRRTEEIGRLLLGNFAGVRIDGSNATIIGSEAGAFRADRNNIPRVWMDHGAWPLLTVKLYVDQTSDLGFLLRPQVYFKDHLTHRSRQTDPDWSPDQGTELRAGNGAIYQGSILEHLLVQHLTAFYHVGEHNVILLEDADWNDGLDMARQRGESVAFTALYAGNLRLLSDLVMALDRQGVRQVALAEELLPLVDRLAGPVDYASISAKRARLAAYFDAVGHHVSGRQASVASVALAQDLSAKAEWLASHLRSQEWIQGEGDCGWFNGYYDDEARRVEGYHPGGVRMTLTGQVFPLMAGIADQRQARAIVRAADRYLFDPDVGGYRLNTDFREAPLCLGRAFGFAYGHKENGAMFSHMAVMYANALYRCDLVAEGWKVLGQMYRHCQDFAKSRMYPGLPEYVSPRGRGMYPYLTGSASWYLLTMVTEVFGVKGDLGDLHLEPKLLPEQFDSSGRAGISSRFAGQALRITYHNPGFTGHDQYQVSQLSLDGSPLPVRRKDRSVVISRQTIDALDAGRPHEIDVHLEARGTVSP